MKKITKLWLMTIFVLTTMLSIHTIANASADSVWLEAEDGVITGEGLEVHSNGGASGGKGLHVHKTVLLLQVLLCLSISRRKETMT